jgi:hypothetical protein
MSIFKLTLQAKVRGLRLTVLNPLAAWIQARDVCVALFRPVTCQSLINRVDMLRMESVAD